MPSMMGGSWISERDIYIYCDASRIRVELPNRRDGRTAREGGQDGPAGPTERPAFTLGASRLAVANPPRRMGPPDLYQPDCWAPPHAAALFR